MFTFTPQTARADQPVQSENLKNWFDHCVDRLLVPLWVSSKHSRCLAVDIWISRQLHQTCIYKNIIEIKQPLLLNAELGRGGGGGGVVYREDVLAIKLTYCTHYCQLHSNQ